MDNTMNRGRWWLRDLHFPLWGSIFIRNTLNARYWPKHNLNQCNFWGTLMIPLCCGLMDELPWMPFWHIFMGLIQTFNLQWRWRDWRGFTSWICWCTKEVMRPWDEGFVVNQPTQIYIWQRTVSTTLSRDKQCCLLQYRARRWYLWTDLAQQIKPFPCKFQTECLFSSQGFSCN